MTTDKQVIHVTSSQHSSTLVSNLNIMLQDEILLDCSLLCDGGLIRAHRVILSAACGYFRTAFTSFPSSSCQNAAVIINDMSFQDLKTIIDFIYEGEISVEVSRIPSLLKSAESLRVESLCAKLSSLATDPCAAAKSPPTDSLSTVLPDARNSLQNLHRITRSDPPPARAAWKGTELENSPIICQALTGIRLDSSQPKTRVNDAYKHSDLIHPHLRGFQHRKEFKQEEQYSSSEEIDIPKVRNIGAATPSVVFSDEEEDADRAPVDLSSNVCAPTAKRWHAKPRDFYANGHLKRLVRTGSLSMERNNESSREIEELKGLCSENFRSSSQSSVDPSGEAELRSDSRSSGENVTLKRGRGRPPRHSLDDELRTADNLMGSDAAASQLVDEVLAYKRLKLNSLGLPTSVRGRKPKLSYSGSRDVSGKNKCPCCPQVYYSTQAMNDHINNVHSKNALKYGCKYCAKEFSWKISLNKHLRKQHSVETSKSCVSDRS